MKPSSFSKKDFHKVALTSAIALGGFAASYSFAAPVSDTATTAATVVAPIAIAQAQDMGFGEFAAGDGGTVTLTTAGVLTPGGDVVVTGTTPTTTAAQFTVTGVADATFSLGITDDDLSSGANTMALATVHALDASSQDSPATGTLTGGTQTIYVGGTLTVAADQAPGAYTGTVTATVEYN